MPLTVLLATTNRAKLARLRLLCESLSLDLVDGPDEGPGPEIDEDGASHMANAVRKAVGWSRLYGGVALASDGGLAVPALGGGWESLRTRRATGATGTDAQRASRLLRRMRDLAGEHRAVHWVEAIAVARGGALLGSWEALGLHGTIGSEFSRPPESLRGFWVAGLWAAQPSGKRYWELSDAERAATLDPWETLAPSVRDLLARLAA